MAFFPRLLQSDNHVALREQAEIQMSNTKTIAKNTGWFGIENIVNLIVTLFGSIAIARTLGPSKNGYMVYVSYIVSVVSGLGGLGIPATTRKYMAEFIGMGDRGTGLYIYLRTIALQAGLATLAAGGLVVWVLSPHPEYAANAAYKAASLLLVLSVWPAMVNAISAQANIAAEDMAKNTPASIISAVLFAIAIAATMVLKWGVIGVGAATLFQRSVDFLVRFFPTMKRMLACEITHAHPEGLRKRMLAFAWQSVTSMLVSLIVWSRSEVILLKRLSPDISQVAFYSVAFTMGEQLLLGATIFGAATGATIFAQYGRDKSRLPDLTASTFRYLVLFSIPLHFIFAALSVSALLLLYGRDYAGATMVVMLAPILCMPKAFMAPAQNLLQSAERQSYVIAATALAGVVDIGVAWYLIPAYGAVGACIGNGTAQTAAVCLMWAASMHLYKVKLPWGLVAKVVSISTLAALTAHFIAMNLAPVWGILCGGSAALVVMVGLSYLLRVLEPEDHTRFNTLTQMLPKAVSGPVDKLLLLLIRPKSSAQVGAGRYS